MKFGTFPVEQSVGAVLAHSIKTSERTIKKGARVDEEIRSHLLSHGIDTVVAAMLEVGDMGEDEAAHRLASTLAGPGSRVDSAFTGRANLFAVDAGVLELDVEAIQSANKVDQAITVATLPNHTRVEAGRMIATVKIIPLAVSQEAISSAEESRSALRVRPFIKKTITLIQTELPSVKASTLDKTREVLDQRLKGTGAAVLEEHRTPHNANAVALSLAKAGPSDLIIIFGASAVIDRNDVLPAGLVKAEGVVDYLGMPVDPGNLLMLGHVGETPVIGAPGCARSPKENGFDWVLDRTLAGIPVSADDISSMGVGGLLMEIVSRPQPRDNPDLVDPVSAERAEPKLGAIILAAGQSRRMGERNKMLVPFEGQPMILHSVKAAREAGLSVLVVTGHEKDEVEAVVSSQPGVVAVHNADHERGMGTSISCGISALPDDLDAVFIMLGDMPLVRPEHLRQLASHLDPDLGHMIIVPTTGEGAMGNPVLFHRRLFPRLAGLMGDEGARSLIRKEDDLVKTVALDGLATVTDFDTAESLDKWENNQG